MMEELTCLRCDHFPVCRIHDKAIEQGLWKGDITDFLPKKPRPATIMVQIKEGESNARAKRLSAVLRDFANRRVRPFLFGMLIFSEIFARKKIKI
ncbi:MAG: hypothetical protein V1705_02345 [bacterium]